MARRAALVALAAGLLSGAACHFDHSCASDVCADGTVHQAGPAWAVRGDDGTTYEVVPALPTLFRREGLRVRIVARKHGGRGAGAHSVEVVRIETI